MRFIPVDTAHFRSFLKHFPIILSMRLLILLYHLMMVDKFQDKNVYDHWRKSYFLPFPFPSSLQHRISASAFTISRAHCMTRPQHNNISIMISNGDNNSRSSIFIVKKAKQRGPLLPAIPLFLIECVHSIIIRREVIRALVKMTEWHGSGANDGCSFALAFSGP